MGKLTRPYLLFKDKEDKKVVGAQNKLPKDLGTAAPPITVSGDAPTTPSVYMCEIFARVCGE